MQGERRRAQAGFSLVEVLCGLFILSLGLLSVAAMQAYYMRQTYLAEEMFAADELASQVMEIVVRDPTQASQITRREIRSCMDSGWIDEVCAALRESLLRDGSDNRLREAEFELFSVGDLWTVNIYWKEYWWGQTHELSLSNSVRL